MSTLRMASPLLAAAVIVTAGWGGAPAGATDLETAAVRHFNKGVAVQDRIPEPGHASRGAAPVAGRAAATNALPTGPSLDEAAARHFNHGVAIHDQMPLGHPVPGRGADLAMLAEGVGASEDTALATLAVRHFNHGVAVQDRITEPR